MAVLSLLAAFSVVRSLAAFSVVGGVMDSSKRCSVAARSKGSSDTSIVAEPLPQKSASCP